jgi:glycosyltransferase involved in cell wall biosynthesis
MAHLLLDLRWMIPGYTGGMEWSARSLVEALLDPEINPPGRQEITLLLPGVARYDFDLRGRPDFHLQVSDGPQSYLDQIAWRLQGRPAGAPPATWINGRRSRATLGLSYSGMIEADLYPLKNLVVVHDLQNEYLPEFFSPQELANRRRDLAASLAQAERVIAISEFTRQTLLERHNLAPERCRVIYQASHPLFEQPASEPEKVWRKYGLSRGNYLYYPSNTWFHKNHRLILQALALLRKQGHSGFLLACSGAPKEAHPSLLALCRELGLEAQFRFLGLCPREELPALYQGAAALVFPSYFEGFGMPVVEAMHCGCPVICSRGTGLAEAAGEAALYIDPDDPAGLAGAIQRVIEEPELRAGLVAAGRIQARRFNWPAFTRALLEDVEGLSAERNPLTASGASTTPGTSSAVETQDRPSSVPGASSAVETQDRPSTTLRVPSSVPGASNTPGTSSAVETQDRPLTTLRVPSSAAGASSAVETQDRPSTTLRVPSSAAGASTTPGTSSAVETQDRPSTTLSVPSSVPGASSVPGTSSAVETQDAPSTALRVPSTTLRMLKPSRTMRSRDRLRRASEIRRLHGPWRALPDLLTGLLLGPDVFFNLALFPALRDRLLRPILRRLAL